MLATSSPLATCHSSASAPNPAGPQTYSNDGVQLWSRNLLSSLDGSQDLLLVLEGEATGGLCQNAGEAPLPCGLSAIPCPAQLYDLPEKSPLQPLPFTKCFHLGNGDKWI